MNYAGFWRRFGAYWVDFAIFLPLIGISYFCSEQSRLFQLYWFVPGLLIGLWFHVYLVVTYGGTPGKLVLKTRIAMKDGTAVTVKAAILRYAVLFILTLLSSVAMIIATLKMTDAEYFSSGYMVRSATLVALAPSWNRLVMILLQVWIWGEFITMMFNKKRRAVHDFIAGTVVIKTSAPDLSV